MEFFPLVFQFFKNWLLLMDKTLNWVLLGDPNETLSQRLGRARRGGSKGACYMCSFLTVLFHPLAIITRTTVQNHCEYALSPGPSIAQEIWHWPSSDTPDPSDVKL
jgi:hypothetical protein